MRNGLAGLRLVVDVDVDGSVNRHMQGADPSVTVLVGGRPYVEVAFAVVVLAGLMKVEAVRAAGDGLGLCKGGNGEQG
jgi:hypothetical protein